MLIFSNWLYLILYRIEFYMSHLSVPQKRVAIFSARRCIKNRLSSNGVHLLISHLRNNQLLTNFLNVMCKDELSGGCFIFSDTDEALEWAEDHLLSQAYPGRQSEPEMELSRVEFFRDF